MAPHISAAAAVYARNFSAAQRFALARRGIYIIGATALPDSTGNCYNPDTGYILDDNATQRILRYAEVVALAAGGG